MKGVIAAGNALTVAAGEEMLWLGGNAFDAAVSAVFCAMVSEPALTSAGGGGCLLAAPAGEQPILFDFFVDMPSGATPSPDFFAVDVNFGRAVQVFHTGRASAAVPGNVAGLTQVQQRLGRLSLSEVLEPARRAAREGVSISATQAYLIRILAPILLHDSRGRALYSRNGEPLGAGQRYRCPSFADFLDALEREGPDLVYSGDGARIMLDWAEEGGLLRASDLGSYRVAERKPLRVSFCGCEVYLNPPPAQSGWLIQVTLSLLEHRLLSDPSPLRPRDLVRALHLTNCLRVHAFPDPSRAPSRDSIREKTRILFQSMEEDAFSGECPERVKQGGGSTTHVSVMDGEGNAASATTTNGEGCGYVLPKLGFMLNNMLGEEDLNPVGFHRYRPGVRLPTMMSPTLVRRGGKNILVTGTAGSNRIRSVITQLLVNVLSRGMSLESATEAPRLHLEGDLLSVEPDFDPVELEELARYFRVEEWQERNLFFGGSSSVGETEAAGDPRRGGASRVLFGTGRS